MLVVRQPSRTWPKCPCE